MYTFFYALPIPAAVAVMLAVFFLWAILDLLAKGNKIWRGLNLGLLLVWIAVILKATVLHRAGGVTELRLLPLQPLLDGSYHNPEYFRALLMNVFLFVPFGAAMTSALPADRRIGRRIGRTVLAGFVLSLLIELVQLRFSLGYAEMDDLLCNTLGTALGACQLLLGKRRRQNGRKD